MSQNLEGLPLSRFGDDTGPKAPEALLFRFSAAAGEGDVGLTGAEPGEHPSPRSEGGEEVSLRLAVGGGIPAGRGGVFAPGAREALGLGRLGGDWKWWGQEREMGSWDQRSLALGGFGC